MQGKSPTCFIGHKEKNRLEKNISENQTDLWAMVAPLPIGSMETSTLESLKIYSLNFLSAVTCFPESSTSATLPSQRTSSKTITEPGFKSFKQSSKYF